MMGGTKAMQRNLIMHVYPKSTGLWRRSVLHVLRRLDQFDGKRVVSVVIDTSTDRANDVCKAFGGAVDIREVHNTSQQEMTSFGWLLEHVSTEPGITFYCHSKGCTHPHEAASQTWCDAMAITCLDYPELIDHMLVNHAMAGSFRSNLAFPQSPASWHYSGTWYWFRNDSLFSNGKAWQPQTGVFYGAESYPGEQFQQRQSACLFLDRAHLSNMYNNDWWLTTGGPQLKAWQERLRKAGHSPLCDDSPNTDTLRKAME